jgi:hypothetical protein
MSAAVRARRSAAAAALTSAAAAPVRAASTGGAAASPAALRAATLALYRAQLRTALKYDAHPHLKPLIAVPGATPLAVPPVPPGSGSGSNPGAVVGLAAHFRRAFLTGTGGGGGAGEPPSPLDAAAAEVTAVYQPVRSLSAFVTRAYRDATSPVVGLPGSTDVGDAADVGTKLDAAFALHRELVVAAALDAELAATGDTALPSLAAAAPGAVAEAPALSPGAVLAQHPAVPSPGRALVVVYDVSQNVRDIHGDEDWVVRGYVVNRPFPKTVADVAGGKAAGGAAGLGAFGSLPAFHGGMDGDGGLGVLHTRADIEGAVPINAEAGCPLYVGGRLDAINAALASGAAAPGDFKVVSGGWEARLVVTGTSVNPATGVVEPDLAWPDAPLWLMATGPGAWAAAMLPPQFATAGRWAGGAGLDDRAAVDGYNYGRFWHQNAAWAHVIDRLGASMEAAAAAAGDADGAARGREVASWARLHAAVVAFTRVAPPAAPASYLALWEETAGGTVAPPLPQPQPEAAVPASAPVSEGGGTKDDGGPPPA